MIRLLIAAPLVLSLVACATPAGRSLKQLFGTSSKGEPALAVGLKQYEDGNYADSARNLLIAIDYGLSEPERAKAHKHLAFIHCSSNRERECRDEFRKALAVQPAMELEPAETGHPIWGPVFRSLKASR
jgi:Tfp pilus assembly protein PilF